MSVLNDTCRTCLNKNEPLLSVFNTEIYSTKSVQFSEMLLECTSVQITADDKLPKIICQKCADQVKSSYEFKITCHNSEQELLKLIETDSNCNLNSKNCTQSESSFTEPEIIIKTDLEQNVYNEDLLSASGKSFTCNICEKTFPKKSKLRIHMDRHLGVKRFRCKICDKGSVEKYDLVKHINKVHEIIRDDVSEYIVVMKQNANAKTEPVVKGNVETEEVVKEETDQTDDLFNDGMFDDESVFDNETSYDTQRDTEELNIDCETCHKTFSERKKYDSHKCNKNKKFKCDFCNDRFAKKGLLEQHVKKSHSKIEKKLKSTSGSDDKTCKICNKSFSGKYKLSIHMNRHVGEKRFNCTQCDECFVEKSELTKHVEKTHSLSNMTNSDFQDNSDISSANEDDSTDKSVKYTLKCSLCLRMFRKKSNYDLHIKRHLGIRKFKCDICPRTYVTHYDLKRHLRTHGELTGFHCKQCYKSFDKSEELEAHMAVHANDAPIVCKECGKQFLMKGNLKLHMAVHSGIRPHLCTVCGRTFRVSRNLKVHMRIHNGEKPYACKTCGKAFAQSAALRVHLPTHSDEKRYVCQTCGKAYNRQNALYAHTRRHLGVRNFPCTMCDKRFYNGTLLRKHFVIHTGEKNFKCEICGKAFNRADHLRVHNKTHNEEQSYNCTVCGQHFLQKQFFINHMTHHQLQ